MPEGWRTRPFTRGVTPRVVSTPGYLFELASAKRMPGASSLNSGSPTSKQTVGLEHARVGMRVRVHEGYRKPDLRGLVGTIKQRYGNDSYAAFEVRFEDGRSELFWSYELEEAGTAAPLSRWRSIFGL